MRAHVLVAVVGCLGFASSIANAAACDGFVDVDAANVSYCPAVTYLKDHAITVGCSDSTHFCPNDNVTRLQMALFLRRMALADPTNVLTGPHAATIGGANNEASGNFSVVLGGQQNKAQSDHAAVMGGNNNVASGSGAAIAGGSLNVASTTGAFVGGGYNNGATAFKSAILGGDGNTASGVQGAVIGGQANTASGVNAVALGGHDNIASGDNSVTVGAGAQADQANCMVIDMWGPTALKAATCLGSAGIVRIGDLHGFSVDYYSQRDDGGGQRWIYVGDGIGGSTINTWTGGYLSDGGTWTNSSDRNAKTDIVAVDVQEVLQKVSTMPIATWRYRNETGQIHLGPMAQDFRAAFGLGADDKHIATIDEGGVALAAIKGLHAMALEKDAELADLRAHNARLEARLATLERAMPR